VSKGATKAQIRTWRPREFQRLGRNPAGPDPLSGRGFPTGLIASLPLPGEAREVVIEGSTLNAEQQTAYLALGARGLGIIKVSQFQMPILLGQLDLPGDTTDVAVDATPKLAAVAANAGGLHLVDVSDPMQPRLRQTLSVDASQVEIIGGVAYVAAGSELRSYDLGFVRYGPVLEGR